MYTIFADEEMSLEVVDLSSGETMISVHDLKNEESMNIVLTPEQVKRLIKELVEVGL